MNKETLEIFPRVQGLNWGEFSLEIEKPDILLGADLFYDEDGTEFSFYINFLRL